MEGCGSATLTAVVIAQLGASQCLAQAPGENREWVTGSAIPARSACAGMKASSWAELSVYNFSLLDALATVMIGGLHTSFVTVDTPNNQ